MAVYLISYTIKKDHADPDSKAKRKAQERRDDILNAIHKYNPEFLDESLYFIDTEKSVDDVYAPLLKLIHKADTLSVIDCKAGQSTNVSFQIALEFL